MKRYVVFCVLFTFLFAISTAVAGTKEEILRMQSDILALQNQIRELEKNLNEKMDGLKSLVVQLNDQVAKSNQLLDRLAKGMESQVSGTQSLDQTLLQEVRAIALKLDDQATRISALAQQVADLKVQAKSTQGGNAGAGLSEDSLYSQAWNDYVQGNLDLAIQEFSAYLSNYPGGQKAAAVQFYLGDAYSNPSQNKLPQAIAAFTRVINDYPGADQVPAALLRRGKAELAMKETDNAIADFKDIIARFPTAPESDLAKEQLRNLGISTAKPAPAKETRRKSR